MKLVQASDFTADTAWAAMELARIPDATVRLHWTDQPYIWHVNDGTEAFVDLDGLVDMHVRKSQCTGKDQQPVIPLVCARNIRGSRIECVRQAAESHQNTSTEEHKESPAQVSENGESCV